MRPLDHALVAVGYGTTAEGQDFWVLKNSWGAHWGERGFLYVPRNTGGKGACGLAAAPGYAVRAIGHAGRQKYRQGFQIRAHAALSGCWKHAAGVGQCSATPHLQHVFMDLSKAQMCMAVVLMIKAARHIKRCKFFYAKMTC